MTADQAIAYMTFALIGAVTPGPSNVMISATGSAVGFLRGLPCALGAAIGMASLLFGAALGLGQIVVAQPMLLNTMNVAGSAFISGWRGKLLLPDQVRKHNERGPWA